MKNAAQFCKSAIAYIKASLPEEGGPVITVSEAEAPVLRDLKNGLIVSYLVDEKDSFSYVQNRHLSEANLSPEQLHAFGCSNLAAIARQKLRIQEYGAVYAVFLDGNFEASLILLDELWDAQLAQVVTGNFAVAIPARDILAFCDSSSLEGIAELKGIVARTSGGDHLLTSSLYERQRSRWAPIRA